MHTICHLRRYLSLLVLVVLTGCATGSLTVIPRAGGTLVPATFEQGMGEGRVSMTLSSGEVLKGRLTWIPPGGNISLALLSNQNATVSGTSMSTGNKGMYIGSLIGENGTTMRVELLCNAWTGNCVGVGQTSAGVIYDVQK